MTSRETSRGTIVSIKGGFVVFDNPDAPDDMRHCEAGRVIGGGFQPAPFAAWALTPETLRAIADLIEGTDS